MMYFLVYTGIGCICTLISIRVDLFFHMVEWVNKEKLGFPGQIMLVYAFIYLWPLLVGMCIIAFLKAFIKELRNRGYFK